MVGSIDEEQLLLEDFNYDKQTLFAGFVEIGETLAETVEGGELAEVGLKAKNIPCYKSQP